MISRCVLKVAHGSAMSSGDRCSGASSRGRRASSCVDSCARARIMSRGLVDAVRCWLGPALCAEGGLLPSATRRKVGDGN